MYETLRKVPLFAQLSDEDLGRVCQVGDEVRVAAGQSLFAEGDAADAAFIIQDGELEVFKRSEQRDILLAVRHAGDVIGEMALIEDAPRMASVRARTDTTLLVITKPQMETLLERSPSAARSLLHTIATRLRGTESQLRQSEKMAQLGTLTAGLAHELNNPAAAVQRGIQQLALADAARQEAELALAALGLDERQRAALRARLEGIRAAAARPPVLGALERSDREEALEGWLTERGVAEPWELAPALVGLGMGPDALAELGSTFASAQVPAVVGWLARQHGYFTVLEEVLQGARRISELVKSLKQYSYLDQAPIQNVDIQEGLESTLVLLRGKLAGGVVVERRYAPDVPRITAYGSELNQVWTNLIDNAIDAMQGKGTLEIRTSVRNEGRCVRVAIVDDGPGIPEAIRGRIFDAFFTTKPPGKGTGLGLDITYNIVVNKHHGRIDVSSRPGRTEFCVELPVNFTTASAGGRPSVLSSSGSSDDELRRILQTTRTIAVVGATDRPDAPAHTVPAYLQEKGYRIVPINPRGGLILGVAALPDLAALAEPPDVVLVFRRSDQVVPIADAAIAARAKVLWMQEGISNDEAAERARAAGLEVVMNTCMRSAHRRLMKGPRG